MSDAESDNCVGIRGPLRRKRFRAPRRLAIFSAEAIAILGLRVVAALARRHTAGLALNPEKTRVKWRSRAMAAGTASRSPISIRRCPSSKKLGLSSCVDVSYARASLASKRYQCSGSFSPPSNWLVVTGPY